MASAGPRKRSPSSKKKAAASSPQVAAKKVAARSRKLASSRGRKPATEAAPARPGPESPAHEGPAPLVGHGELLERLLVRCRGLRDRRSQEVPRPVMLVAPPGAGASRVLDELARRAREEGVRVALIRPPECDGDQSDPLAAVEGALLSIADIKRLRSYALGAGRGVLSASAARAVARILAGREMRGLSLDRSMSRMRLERGLAEVMSSAAQKRPLVLLVDQAERLGDVSLGALLLLARIACTEGMVEPLQSAPVFVVIASHEPGPDRLQPLINGDVADCVSLPALDDGEAAELVSAVAPGLKPAQLKAVVKAGGGLPLRLEHGARALAAGAGSDVLQQLEKLLAVAVGQLSPLSAHVLAMLARAGRLIEQETLLEALRFWLSNPDRLGSDPVPGMALAGPLELGAEPGFRKAVDAVCDRALAQWAPEPSRRPAASGSAELPSCVVVAHSSIRDAVRAALPDHVWSSLAAALALAVERQAAWQAERALEQEDEARGEKSGSESNPGVPVAEARPRGMSRDRRSRVGAESTRVRVQPRPGEDAREVRLRMARRAALGPWRALLCELRPHEDLQAEQLASHAELARRAFVRHDDELAARYLKRLATEIRADRSLPAGWQGWEVLSQLGATMESAGRVEEALALYVEARESLLPDDAGDALPRVCRDAARMEAQRGNLDRARQLLALARNALQQEGPDASPAERGAVLALSGRVALQRGERDVARRHLRRAITVAEAISDRDLAASCLSDLGQVQWMRGEVDAARRFFERVLRLREELGDVFGHAQAQARSGAFRVAVGEGAAGSGLLRRSRRAYTALGREREAAQIQHAEGLAYLSVADWGAALACLEQSAARQQAVGDQAGALSSLGEKARLLARLGLEDSAKKIMSETRRQDVEPAVAPLTAVALYRARAAIEERRGQWRGAISHLEEAVRLTLGASELPLAAEALLELSQVRIMAASEQASDSGEGGRETLERADEIIGLLGLRRLRGRSLLIRGSAGALVGRAAVARQRMDVEEALAIALEVSDRDLEAAARERLALLLTKQDDVLEADAQRQGVMAAVQEMAATLPEAMRETYRTSRERSLKAKVSRQDADALSAGQSDDLLPAHSMNVGQDTPIPGRSPSFMVGAGEVNPDSEVGSVGDEGGPQGFNLFDDTLAEGTTGAGVTSVGDLASLVESQRLVRLLEINKALNAELELDRLFDMIIDAARGLVGARRGFIVIWENGMSRMVRSRNLQRQAVDAAERSLSQGLIREAVETGRTVVTGCASEERSGYESTRGLDLKSVVVAPLIYQGNVLGAIYLDDSERRDAFGTKDVRTVEAFSEQAALALTNARLHGDLSARMQHATRSLVRAEEELRRQRSDMQRRYRHGNLIGMSDGMQNVYRILDRAKDSAFPIIIQGESGTGKELVAKYSHFNGLRRDKPFVAENCGALPETLLDSELFGYVKGAFTGAFEDKKGLFELADGGTLFLDEIEEMSAAMQRKLLRVLQEGEVRPIGARSTRRVDVRVVCATNRDVGSLLEQGEFRRDLYYRLNVIRISLPPLRERREDIPLLLEHFLEELEGASGEKTEITEEAMRFLCVYPWPGNIRELQNELKRLDALGIRLVRKEDLSLHVQEPQRLSRTAPGDEGGVTPVAGAVEGLVPMLPDLPLREVERILIRQTLERTGGNKTQAAKQLGLSRRGLLKKVARYGPDGP